MENTALVPLLETIYALDLDDQSWITRALSATKALCGRGADFHYLGYFYDASDVTSFKFWNLATLDQPPEVNEAFHAAGQVVTPALLQSTLLTRPTGSTRKNGMPDIAPLMDARARVGWGDIFTLNGMDPSGIGCLVTIGTRDPEFVPPPEEERAFGRIAHHLATAFRCRRKLGRSRLPGQGDVALDHAAAEAILDERGDFVHAEGEAASKTARERIQAAAQSINALRSRGRSVGREALDSWHPLVAARWTLVDTFEESGRRYIVARENQADGAQLELLTDRERQVVLQAALGLSNKEIAYALGISDSTVRVLIARAAGRMGVRSRSELMAHPALGQSRVAKA
ncbi:MAG TPA: LuxR C-terminal-related transcriptional regulator [Polyangiaceae bacterium]|nr:LuxR C-terminal-related transcriptional regulator [Polyangiaceae bacterium]